MIQNVDAGVPDDISATDEGFGIAGSGNRLTRNVVTNEDFGIFVFTGSNTIENNIAIRNGFDLLDSTKDCSNIWQNNIFETSNQPCIGGTTTPLVSMNASETRALESFAALPSKITGMESEARPENFFQGRPGRPALKFGLRAEAAGSPLRKSSLENENVETIRQKTRLGTAKSLI